MKQAILQVRVDEELKQAMTKQAEKRKLSISALMTIYLMEGLSNDTKREQMQGQIVENIMNLDFVKEAIQQGIQLSLPVD